MAVKKRKLRKALFNTSTKPLTENKEKPKRRKVWFGLKTCFEREKTNVVCMPCRRGICISVLRKVILYLITILKTKVGYLFFSALGARPHMSAVGPSAPGPITSISAGFYFLSVCIVKCSCAKLIKHICEFSIHKY